MISVTEKAQLVFFSLKSPFGYDRTMQAEDIQKIEEAIRSAMGDGALGSALPRRSGGGGLAPASHG